MIPLNALSKHQRLSKLWQCLKNFLKEKPRQLKEHFGVALLGLSNNEKKNFVKTFSESVVELMSEHVASEAKNSNFYFFGDFGVFWEFGLASAAFLCLYLLEGVLEAD